VARTKPCPIKNPVENPAQKTNLVRIFFDGAVPFYRAAKNLQVFAIHVNPTNNKHPQSKLKPVKLLEKYKDFADVFEKNKANQLPEHRPYDCPIDLKDTHHPLVLSMAYRNRNSKPYVITILKPCQGVRPTFQVSNRRPNSICQEEGQLPSTLCGLSWTQQDNQKESISLALDFRRPGSTTYREDLHQA